MQHYLDLSPNNWSCDNTKYTIISVIAMILALTIFF
jgi:hypothetical protein